MTGVFGGNEINGFERLKGPQRDIFEIAYGGGNNEQHMGHMVTASHGHMKTLKLLVSL